MERHPEEVRVKTKGAGDVSPQLVILVNKSELLWKQMFGFVSDSAPAMIEKQNGVAAKFKKNQETTSFLIAILFISKHCVKTLKTNRIFDTVIKQNGEFYS